MKIIILFFMLILTTSLLSNDITVSWNANSEPDLAGYKIYYGLFSRNYSNILDVGNITSYEIELPGGVKYFFAVTAYDTAANESVFSEEVSIYLDVPDTTKPGIVQNIQTEIYKNNRIIVSWDFLPDKDIQSYIVAYGIDRQALKSYKVGIVQQYITEVLQEGQLYFFQVTAVDSANNTSKLPDLVLITIPIVDRIPPSKPTGLKVH
jgi:hypothetical protein